MQILTQSYLKQILYYDPLTGILKRKISSGTAKIGDIAGYKSGKAGYIRLSIDGKEYLAHIIIFLYMEGYLPEHDIDHINRIKDDNRWENLRHVTRQCNMRNRSKNKNNTSGITGVSWNESRKRWESKITVNYLSISLGRFIELENAVIARWGAEVKYNFPNCNTTSSAYTWLQNNE